MAPAPTTESLATLLVLADGRLPAGAHAHSGGLEPAVAAGRVRDLDSLHGFLHGRLATSGLVAAAFAAATTRRAAEHCVDLGVVPVVRDQTTRTSPRSTQEWGWVGELDAALDARTPSPALRRAARAQGRALLRAGRAMWALPAVPLDPAGPYQPVALGIVAAAAGLHPHQAALLAAYGSVSGPANAAVRLLGLDPYPVHGLLAGLAPACNDVAARAAALADASVADLPAASGPLIDISAEAHAIWEVRLFAS